MSLNFGEITCWRNRNLVEGGTFFGCLNTTKDVDMTTTTGHTSAILASKVKGSTVYNIQGEKIGQVEDVILHKQSARILFAALGFGGVFGMGEKFYPVPWSLLDYDAKKGGYIVPIAKDQMDKAPAYRLEDLTKNDGNFSEVLDQSYSFYDVERDY